MNDDDLDRAIRALPRTEAPPDDLWSAIEARIQPPRYRWIWAAAAVAAVVGGWMLLGHAPEERPVQTPIVSARPGPSTGPGARALESPDPKTSAAVSPEETALEIAATELFAAYTKRRRLLDQDLLAVFDDNLAVVDDAIERSRAALRTRPRDEHLQQVLRRAYDHKLELLRTATAVGELE